MSAPTVEHLLVQCGPGLEKALAAELARWNLAGHSISGGVELTAPVLTYEDLNVWSRIANRVMLRVGDVRSAEDLKKLPWGRYGSAFILEASGEEPSKWKEAALSFLPQGPGPTVYLRGHHGRCLVSVDTSGELLYFRGYRQEVGRAPLRETLASAVLEMAQWRPGEPLWDIMCGSGTFVIEAAEQAAGLAPGRGRKFAFEAFPAHDAANFAKLARVGDAQPTPIFGTDLNAGALGTARRNAKRAGVLELITLERLDATNLTPRPEVSPGLIIANLPYGKRVGERNELAGLYREVGKSLRKAARGWRFAFLLQEGHENLGLSFETVTQVKNGGLSCTVVTGTLG